MGEELDPAQDGESPVWAHGTGFHPPATVAVAGLLAAAGLVLVVLGTPVLKLPRGIQLPLGAELAKLLLGAILLGAGAGLYMLRPWSRNLARLLVGVGGLLAPLYPWHSNPLHLRAFDKLALAIDWEFAWTFRGLVFLGSLVVVAYLSRRSVAYALEHGGVPAVFEGYVCVGCNGQVDAVPPEGCEVCGGPFYEQYRSLGGVCYLREC